MKTTKTKTKAKVRARKTTSVGAKSRSKSTRVLTVKAKKSIRHAARRNYPVHKRVLLHPVAVFVLLCTGVFLGGWTYQGIADTTISSVIEAPPLTSGAAVTSPLNGTSITLNPIDVTGTCPDNSYVKLFVNGAFTGVAWCSSQTFTITTTLNKGTNDLVAKDYNVTDLEGPTTQTLEVTYALPANPPAQPTLPPSSTSSGNSTNSTTTTTLTTDQTTSSAPITADSQVATVASTDDTQPPLLLTSDYHFQTFAQQKEFTWQFDLEGGTPPYDVYIDWGDSMTTKLHFDADPLVTLTHTYKTTGYYPIVIKSIDKYAQARVIQLAALITPKSGQSNFPANAAPGAGSTTSAASGSTTAPSKPGSSVQSSLVTTRKWLFLAWPSYLIIMLMVVSFWLGERREYAYIKVKRRK